MLVVRTDPAALRATVDRVRETGCHAFGVDRFEHAKRILELDDVDILIADCRLGAFNGMHLVHVGRHTRPGLVAVLLGGEEDRALCSGAGVRLLDPGEMDTLVAHVVQLAGSAEHRV